ncbi:hypothetical protein JCM11641_000922 [Rhodosporidiobolus odoratus]
MSGRVRKPTMRALDAAESRLLASGSLHHASPPPGSSSISPSASAPVKRNGRAQNDKGRRAMEQEQAQATQLGQQFLVDGGEGMDFSLDSEGQETGANAGEQDLTLYCVCLGYDNGEQPMIQCEHCSNWFHFSCVNLTDDTAANIEAYTCEMCEQMGMGSTRFLVEADPPAPAVPLGLPPSAFDTVDLDRPPVPVSIARGEDGHYDLPTSDEGEDDDDMEEDDDDEEDGEFEVDGRKRRKAAAAGKRSKRKTGGEEWDGEYNEDDGEDRQPQSRAQKKAASRKRRTVGPRQGSSDVKPAHSGPAPSVPTTDKTRSTVVKQLTTLFSAIFSTTAGEGASAGLDVRSAALAEEVEGELFDAFAELDDKGYRAPRPKYANKFRSLAFNLKSNAVLRSRVAGNELSAQKIANLTPDDLQTPELRAMAESVRAASLRNSVKEALAAPTAKRTHKGEEEIDNEAARIVAAEEAERAHKVLSEKKEAERFESNSLVGSPAPAPFVSTPAAASPAAVPQSPSTRESPGFFHSSSSTSTPRIRSSLPTSTLAFSSSLDEFKAAFDAPSPAHSSKHGSPPPAAAASPSLVATGSPQVKVEEEGEMSPPPPPEKRRSSSNFDMASIWGKVKGASPPLPASEKFGSPGPSEEEDRKPGEMSLEEQEPYEPADPFDLMVGKGGSDDDFDEDDLFRDPGASPKKKAPPRAPSPQLDELPPAWFGDVLVPEEGGFPSKAVQVAGRPLGLEVSTWKQLLPRTLSTAGRIGTDQAVKYLVECSFSQKRELVVVSLFPDTSGPTSDRPDKPAGERCVAKQKHIFDHFVKRGRIGVVQPSKDIRHVVRDIYIAPLGRDEPIPEYVELADEHRIPEKGRRKQDLVLCILVINKGVLPTAEPAPPPQPAPSDSKPPTSSAPPTGPRATTGVPTGPKSMMNSPAPLPSGSPPPPHPDANNHSPQSPHLHSYGAVNNPPPAVQSLLSQFDPATLSSLLANPALAGALGASPSAAGPGGSYGGSRTQPHVEGGGHGAGQGAPGVHPARLAMMNQGFDGSLSSGSSAPAGGMGMQHDPQYGRNEAFGAGDGGWGMRSSTGHHGGQQAPQQPSGGHGAHQQPQQSWAGHGQQHQQAGYGQQGQGGGWGY